VARPTKRNIIKCKPIKGGRAGCWIKERGKTVFRFADPKVLKGLGIAFTEGKMLPGFTGAKRTRKTSGRKRTKTSARKRTKRTGCKTFKNGRKGCWTSKGFRIVS